MAGEPHARIQPPSGSLKLVPRAKFHELCHTHASHLVKTVAHSKIVQERLGHSTIAITMDLYSPLLDGMETGAAERIDEAFAIAKEQPPV
jgi:integrase